jgi:hypothetical protein
MPELAEVFRRYGPEYRQKYNGKILPSHYRAMWDIENCRTVSMGGHVYVCEDNACREFVFSYHSCKNRHCNKCQNDQSENWLQKQQQKLLPVPYFLVTPTLPAELRKIARANQKTVYNILFKSSAEALMELAKDPRFIGGEIGLVGVMHTWDKRIGYHPHTHYLVPGGGLSPDHSRWLPAKNDFLVHVTPLAVLFKAKFRDALKKTGLFEDVPREAWKKEWGVHCEPVGSGKEAAIYLARYLFRVAITNNRLIKIENDTVTYRCQDSHTRQWHPETRPALEFMHRFLQHVLPKGFQKVRYYGFFSNRKKNLLAVARYVLAARVPDDRPVVPDGNKMRCPKCGKGLRLIGKISRHSRGPPEWNRAAELSNVH